MGALKTMVFGGKAYKIPDKKGVTKIATIKKSTKTYKPSSTVSSSVKDTTTDLKQIVEGGLIFGLLDYMVDDTVETWSNAIKAWKNVFSNSSHIADTKKDSYFDFMTDDYQSYLNPVQDVNEEDVTKPIDTEGKTLVQILSENNAQLANAFKSSNVTDSSTSFQAKQLESMQSMSKSFEVIANQSIENNVLQLFQMQLMRKLKDTDVDIHMLKEGHYSNMENIANSNVGAVEQLESTLSAKQFVSSNQTTALQDIAKVHQQKIDLDKDYIENHKKPLVKEQTTTHKTLNENDDDIDENDVNVFNGVFDLPTKENLSDMLRQLAIDNGIEIPQGA